MRYLDIYCTVFFIRLKATRTVAHYNRHVMARAFYSYRRETVSISPTLLF